eukprot:1507219-Alexandrium_andersonii.AAC.1
MSASLVGSEMCIRDRGNKHNTLAANTWAATAWQHFTGGKYWQQPRAVSYTHLTLPTICSV